MSRPRFLTDQDFAEPIIAAVLARESDAEFVRARQVGFERARDEDLLAYAAEQGLILLSHDANTMVAAAYRRLMQDELMTGLFITPQQRHRHRVVDNLVLICSASEAEEWIGKIVFIPEF